MKGRLRVACALAGLVLGVPAVADYVTMVDNGPNTNRVNIVFLGDGYTASQIESTYVAHIDGMLKHMFDEGEDPFPRYRRFFNVHRINVVSAESGADVPPLGIFRNTALDASYYYDGVTERLLYVNSSKATSALNAGLSGANFSAGMKLVTVNDSRYGGGGGTYAVFAGANGAAPEIALHELGHSFAGLADEYGDYSGSQTVYQGAEPSEPNVTKDPSGAKWQRWIGYNQPGIGLIGAYEGARYYNRGLYRPSENSKMRSLGRPFDAVGREEIILDVYRHIKPLDAFLANGSVVTDPDKLWVKTVDPSVIGTQWKVDGTTITGAIGETFDLRAFGFGAGNFTVTALSADPTDWVRADRTRMQQSVTWNVVMTVPEPFSALALAVGVFGIAATRRRR